MNLSCIKSSSWITLGLCLAAGIGIFAETAGYPAAQGGSAVQGSAFYPRVLAGLMMALGLMLPVRDCFTAGAASEASCGETCLGPVVLVFGLAVVMAFLIPYLGFLGAGAVFLLLAALAVGREKKPSIWLSNLGFSLGMMVLIYLVFERFVGLYLPKPVWMS